MMPRRGSILLDAMVATALLAVTITLSAQAISTISRAQRSAEDRSIALQIAAGALERVAAWPSQQVTADKLDEYSREHPTSDALPGTELVLTVDEVADEPAARRICSEVRWRDGAAFSKPVRLYYWLYRPGRETP